MAKARNHFSADASARQIRERGMTMLELMIAKWAMNPVCHVCSTDNVAVAAAA